VVEASVCKTDLSGFESRRYLQFFIMLHSLLYDLARHRIADVDPTGVFMQGELYAGDRHFGIYAPALALREQPFSPIVTGSGRNESELT
jgi:hypothetical protein